MKHGCDTDQDRLEEDETAAALPALTVLSFTDAGNRKRDTAVVDVDGDGLLDLLATDTQSNSIVIYRQIKGKGMQVNELSFAEASRMRNKLTRVYASIGADVGMDLWIATQNELVKVRAKK